MPLQRQLLFWTLALIGFVLVLYLLRPILLPFIAGMALAYMLDPLADRIERLGVRRLPATLLILILFTLLFVLFFVAVVPILWQQIGQLAERIPDYATRLNALARDLGNEVLDSVWLSELLGLRQDDAGGDPIRELGTQAAGWIAQLLQSIVTGGLAFVNLLALLVVTPVVAFYLLYDWDRLVASVDSWVPREHVQTVRDLAWQIDRALAGFVRGQGLLCIILALFYGTALTLVGLNFGLLIGIGAGLISFVPFIGSILGFVVAVAVALVQFWPDWIWIVAVAAIFIIGNAVEGNILQPRLVGSKVGLHPVWLIFAVFAFGYLFGFVGVLIAVPLAAAVGVVSRFALRQYLDSAIYRGGGPGDGVPRP